MIEDLRFVERQIPAPEYGEGFSKIGRILQAYDGHVWFDVPLMAESSNMKRMLGRE
jgi:hypothetical protein